jgi:hypothetical protein
VQKELECAKDKADELLKPVNEKEQEKAELAKDKVALNNKITVGGSTAAGCVATQRVCLQAAVSSEAAQLGGTCRSSGKVLVDCRCKPADARPAA